jgi:hypothetical protein
LRGAAKPDPAEGEARGVLCSLLYTAGTIIRYRRYQPKVGTWTLEELPIILIVEDDQLLQSVIEEALTDGGFEIVIAASGANAVELLNTMANFGRW